MDEVSYASFLVRLWHPADSNTGAWCGEIEHIQSGECRTFATLDAALLLLRQALEPSYPPTTFDLPPANPIQ